MSAPLCSQKFAAQAVEHLLSRFAEVHVNKKRNKLGFTISAFGTTLDIPEGTPIRLDSTLVSRGVGVDMRVRARLGDCFELSLSVPNA